MQAWLAQNAMPTRPGGDAAGVALDPEPQGPDPGGEPRGAYYSGKRARKKPGRTAVGRVEAGAAAARVRVCAGRGEAGPPRSACHVR